MLQTLNWTDEAKPCTLDEVKFLEQKLNLSLPLAYQEFLLWMGHGSGEFMRGEDFQFGQLKSIREGALELMQFNNFPEPLPDDAIVFTIHQGCAFGFMQGSEGCNPPIHFYFEQENGQGLIKWNNFNNLESYLLDYMESLIKFFNKS
ncbi:MAG: SMI1/KNR4 family protein [Elainella sp. C42_A2020_010]|nr:SMI1/KNR4 family protein [Elainella sp. C42_A2020_010]